MRIVFGGPSALGDGWDEICSGGGTGRDGDDLGSRFIGRCFGTYFEAGCMAGETGDDDCDDCEFTEDDDCCAVLGVTTGGDGTAEDGWALGRWDRSRGRDFVNLTLIIFFEGVCSGAVLAGGSEGVACCSCCCCCCNCCCLIRGPFFLGVSNGSSSNLFGVLMGLLARSMVSNT